jgi:hypothetical protein
MFVIMIDPLSNIHLEKVTEGYREAFLSSNLNLRSSSSFYFCNPTKINNSGYLLLCSLVGSGLM